MVKKKTQHIRRTLGDNTAHRKRQGPRVFCSNVYTRDMTEASGLCLSTNGKFFYVVNDSPHDQPYIFVFDKETMKRSIIKIIDIEDNRFNPGSDGSGFGDWEAIAMGSLQGEPHIVVGDIGQNKVRNKGGVLRTRQQQTRLIYVKEPTEDEIVNSRDHGGVLSEYGHEFEIQYSSRNHQFDSEALAIIDDFVFIISKNSIKYNKSSIYMIEQSSLIPKDFFDDDDKRELNTMHCVGRMRIPQSEVTDAFMTDKLLALRTYAGIHLVQLSSLDLKCERKDHVVKIDSFRSLQEIKYEGLQEAMCYDHRNNFIYLLGEGSKKMFEVSFDVGKIASRWQRPLPVPVSKENVRSGEYSEGHDDNRRRVPGKRGRKGRNSDASDRHETPRTTAEVEFAEDDSCPSDYTPTEISKLVSNRETRRLTFRSNPDKNDDREACRDFLGGSCLTDPRSTKQGSIQSTRRKKTREKFDFFKPLIRKIKNFFHLT